MKSISVFIFCFGLTISVIGQRIECDVSKLPNAVTDPNKALTSDGPTVILTGFKRKEAENILSNSFTRKKGDEKKESLKTAANKEANKVGAGSDFKSLLKPNTAKDEDPVSITLNRNSLLPDSLKSKDTVLLIIGNGKQSQTISIGVPEVKDTPKNNIDSIQEQVLFNWPGNTSCSKPPNLIFLTNSMISDNDNDFLFGIQNCFDKKRKRKLAGEYILLYDYRSGDYYPFKKVTRKPSANDIPICEKKYVEFYKLKKSPFFSPAVGSQFKVELMNYNDTIPLSLEIAYMDNFLAEEARFQSLLSAFQQGTSKPDSTPKKDSATPEKEEQAEIEKASEEKYDSLLVQLIRELCYYTSNFNYTSLTADIHNQNIEIIVRNIRNAFDLKDDQDIISGITGKVKKTKGSETQIQKLALFFNRLNNFQSIVYTAFRTKNRDNLLLQFKDDKGRIRKEEELRLSNGFKVDFSTGIFITGLKDHEYVFKDTTVSYITTGGTDARDTTGNFIIRENSSKRKIGFGLLTHAYPRLSSNYNFGIATGISVNTEAEVNLLAGLSLMLGSQRRVVFSGGLIWGKANRLSKTVYEGFNRKAGDVTGTSAPVFYSTPNNVVPIINDWQRSWFMGVSYNFSAK